MGIFDNPTIKKLALSQLSKLFSEGVTAILITMDENENPIISSYKEPVKIVTESELNNLVKTLTDGTNEK